MHLHYFKKYFDACRGFSLIEVILTIALLLGIAMLTMPLMSGSLSQNELDAAADTAADVLNQTRSSAMSGVGEGKFGVHFETDQFVTFVGDVYAVGDSANEYYPLPGFVEITSVTISGGGSEMIFANVAGTPLQTGSLVFTDSAGLTRTIAVNAAGTVDSY
ncbi:MAG: prepilin-type N-terminal cleavage/methylation domain-containing protein [Patescibacteria group bacterium]